MDTEPIKSTVFNTTTLDERAIRVILARDLGYRLRDIDVRWQYSEKGEVVGVLVVEKPNWQRQ